SDKGLSSESSILSLSSRDYSNSSTAATGFWQKSVIWDDYEGDGVDTWRQIPFGRQVGRGPTRQESMSTSVEPSTASSARTRPTRQENLKPCPLQGLATITSARPAGEPTWNCSSGATVYRQTSVRSIGASATA